MLWPEVPYRNSARRLSAPWALCPGIHGRRNCPCLERFSFVLRTSWACRLDNSSSSEGATVHSLGASAPGPGDTSKEAFSSSAGATGASRGRALLSPRWGSKRGRARVAWGHPGAYALRL